MALIVQKYGGTSVGTIKQIKNVAEHIIETKRQGHQVVAVVSAMGKSTDRLISLARKVADEPAGREYDALLATGEQISSSLLAMTLNARGCRAVSLGAYQLGIKTDENHSRAEILDLDASRIISELDEGNTVVATGFQGLSGHGEITTLGRGGSDLSAVALAAVLKADSCEIYTDVDGVYRADPNVVPGAERIETISYEEMLELASLGAGVLQPACVEFAKKQGVVIHVKRSCSWGRGTIVKEVSEEMNKRTVTGVARDAKTAKIAVLGVPDRPGTAYRIFQTLADARINVDMIVQSIDQNQKNDILFTVSQDDMLKAVRVVGELGEALSSRGIVYDPDVAKVSIVGAGMINNYGVAATMFSALAKAGINIQIISTSEIKISCLVDEESSERAVQALADEFGLRNMKGKQSAAVN